MIESAQSPPAPLEATGVALVSCAGRHHFRCPILLGVKKEEIFMCIPCDFARQTLEPRERVMIRCR